MPQYPDMSGNNNTGNMNKYGYHMTSYPTSRDVIQEVKAETKIVAISRLEAN